MGSTIFGNQMTIDDLKNNLNSRYSDFKLAAQYEPLTIEHIEFALSNVGDFKM